MFNNIGKKIKTLAKVLCWIGIIGSFIGGIVLAVSGASSSKKATDILLLILFGLAAAIIGAFLAWISSFVLYGFGELVDSTQEIKRSNEEILNRVSGGAQQPQHQQWPQQ
ncbi:MAG: hypothetical protein IKZ81_02170 [Clostridia bacterium]|nr:hypothetical protein [Clostridia bacterium]